jgi:RimJ/RimL family protein N-acetyltransferase
MVLTLREVWDEDLPLLFEQWADPVAVHMAAFTAPDHMDREAFERRWSRLRADETVLARVIVVDDDVAGTIGSWGEPGEREVTYWIGRSYWGKGIATDALNAFLAVDRSRPLHARVASDNVASRRVLEKCGFRVIATERAVAEARSAEIEELVLRLDELAPTESPRQRSAVQGLYRLPGPSGLRFSPHPSMIDSHGLRAPVSRASVGVGGCILRAPGGPIDLDRYALRVGSRLDQVKRNVRAGLGE